MKLPNGENIYSLRTTKHRKSTTPNSQHTQAQNICNFVVVFLLFTFNRLENIYIFSMVKFFDEHTENTSNDKLLQRK